MARDRVGRGRSAYKSEGFHDGKSIEQEGSLVLEGLFHSVLYVEGRLRISHSDRGDSRVSLLFGDPSWADAVDVATHDASTPKGRSPRVFQAEFPTGTHDFELQVIGQRAVFLIDNRVIVNVTEGLPPTGRVGFQWSKAELEFIELRITGKLSSEWESRLLSHDAEAD